MQVVDREDARPVLQQGLQGLADAVVELVAEVAWHATPAAGEGRDGSGELRRHPGTELLADVLGQLDEGPIIEQAVDPVYYKDTVDDLRRKGRNLEQRALANAVHAYLDHRIIRDGQKTIVFQ